MMRLSYRCKICGRSGAAKYDLDCPINDIEKWRSMLTCDRCYDYRDALVGIRMRILKVTRYVEVERHFQREVSESEVRSRLANITKQLTTLVTQFYGTTNQWDCAVVDMLVQSPESAGKIISDYVHILKPKPKQNQPI